MKKSLKKKNKIISNSTIGFFLICLAFIFLFSAVRIYSTGFHNVDLFANYCIMSETIEEKYENIELKHVYNTGDYTSQGYMSYASLYSVGLTQLIKGFNLLFFSGILFTFGVYLIFN